MNSKVHNQIGSPSNASQIAKKIKISRRSSPMGHHMFPLSLLLSAVAGHFFAVNAALFRRWPPSISPKNQSGRRRGDETRRIRKETVRNMSNHTISKSWGGRGFGCREDGGHSRRKWLSPLPELRGVEERKIGERTTPPRCHRSPPSLKEGELRGRPIGLGFWEGGVG